MSKSTLFGLFSGIAAASIWGGMYVVSKVVLDVIPPFTLLSSRLFLGILTLGVIVILRGNVKVPSNKFWQIFGVGFVGYGISLGFQFTGTKLSTASNGALVTSATPAFVLLFAWMLLGERITLKRFLSLLISTLGVLAVIDPRTAELSPALFWGNLSLLAAALTWALYSVLIRVITRSTDVLTVSLITFFGGLPLTIPVSMWETFSIGIGMVTPGVIAGVLFIGIISTGLAMYLWNTAFATLDASVASLTFFAQPLVGSLLGWAFLRENITPLFLLGGLMIGVGLVLANIKT
jgi:drug/metabolite transporter (DMT)-like permease